MKYISLFSGIGGLELRGIAPELLVDSDPACHTVLQRMYPDVPIETYVEDFKPPYSDVIVGGWPCQDLTVAGRMAGIRGQRSALFFQMLRVAKSARAHTVIGENVPNLVRLRGGKDFGIVLRAFGDAGFRFVSWRTLNAREFGLPQERRRIVLVASKRREISMALHRRLPKRRGKKRDRGATEVIGFYWTGGARGLCLSENYSPTLKVGASPPKGGTSSTAVFFEKTVRKLTAGECLGLQGFSGRHFYGVNEGAVSRMAGNAVPRPLGDFAVRSVLAKADDDGKLMSSPQPTEHGFWDGRDLFSQEHESGALAENLEEFVELSNRDCLSPQAAAGLLVRVIRGRKRIPVTLFDVLYSLSLHRTSKLKGTRVNSFDILHEQLEPQGFRSWLTTQSGQA